MSIQMQVITSVSDNEIASAMRWDDEFAVNVLLAIAENVNPASLADALAERGDLSALRNFAAGLLILVETELESQA